MKKVIWYDGPPPAIGWWPASCWANRDTIRYWNGEWWSESCLPSASAERAGHTATKKAPDQERIKWSARWWGVNGITWHNGPPPAIGWWPASFVKDMKSIRFWDGKYWSIPAYSEFSAEEAAERAKKRSFEQRHIQWSARWW